MKLKETDKQQNLKKLAVRKRIVFSLVVLLLFQIWFPFHEETSQFENESGKCHISCQTTDQNLFLVRPLPLILAQAGILRNVPSSFVGSSLVSMIPFRGNASHFSSISEMRLELLSHYLHAQINRPLRN